MFSAIIRRVIVWGLCALLIAPLLAIVAFALLPGRDDVPGLGGILADHAGRTLALLAGTGAGVFVIGTGAGFATARLAFPARRMLAWALVLPLAMPVYITAYVYAELLDYAGPVQSALRALFGWTRPDDYAFPPIRSLGGAVFVMSLALYPYVYLAAYGLFARQGGDMLNAGRTLGASFARAFTKTALPLARPALAAGVALALMECLNDIGAAEHLGVRTLTVGLYDMWLTRGYLTIGAQIATLLLLFALLLLTLERAERGRRRHDTDTPRLNTRVRLPGGRGWLACGLCALPVALGFVVPVATLAFLSVGHIGAALDAGLLSHAARSVALAGTAALVITAVGLFLAWSAYRAQKHLTKNAARLAGAARLAAMGYAIPGAVLALGVLAPLAAFDDFLIASGLREGALLTGGVWLLVLAYLVRFLALPFGVLDAHLSTIAPALGHAAQMSSARGARVFGRIYLPMLLPSLLIAALLVFVETLRELPATLILRPFDFETLATHVYTYASLGLLEESAPAALLLALLGLVPALLWARSLRVQRD